MCSSGGYPSFTHLVGSKLYLTLRCYPIATAQKQFISN